MARSEPMRASFLRRCFRSFALGVIQCFIALARAGNIVDPRCFGPVVTEVIAKIPDNIDDHHGQRDREEGQSYEQDRTVEKPVHLRFADPIGSAFRCLASRYVTKVT